MPLQDYQADGQAADAISADTLVKMEDAPRLLGIPKSECSSIFCLPRSEWSKSWGNNEDPLALFE